MRAGKDKKSPRAPATGRGTATEATGRSLAAVVLELRRAQHRAAVLEHLAQRVFSEYSAEEAEPRFLIATGTEAPVLADTDALIEASAMLTQTAAEARRRAEEILLLQLPGPAGPTSVVDTTDEDRFVSRVVATPPQTHLWRG